jgi:hypothetical protein
VINNLTGSKPGSSEKGNKKYSTDKLIKAMINAFNKISRFVKKFYICSSWLITHQLLLSILMRFFNIIHLN